MTETTKRLLIAGVAAAVLIAGSVAAIAIIDDSDDDRDGPLVAIAEELEDDFEAGEFLEELLESFGIDAGSADLPERLFDLLDTLRGDLLPPGGFEFDPDESLDSDRRHHAPRPFRRDPGDRESFDGFGFPFAPGESPFDMPFFDGPLLERFFGDGEISPEEARELERFFGELFGVRGSGFGFGRPAEPFAFPEEPFVGPGFPQLGEFLEDGHISPDEARELERLFRESVPGGVFQFEFVPPQTDRAFPNLPQALLEGLGQIPFREFFADGEFDSFEQEALRDALNEWLDHVFERFAATG